MIIWLEDEKTDIQCGINDDGNLFLGDNSSGSNLPDTMENREKIINDFCRYTGRQKPVISAAGSPIKNSRSLVDFSR